MFRFIVWIICLTAAAAADLRADELLYAYEGDVLPYDASAGWIIADPCTGPCSEMVTDEAFTLSWNQGSNDANYHLWIAGPNGSLAPPPPFWVEWRFASNQLLRNIQSCDGRVSITYREVVAILFMFGDAVVSFDGGSVHAGFDVGRYRTHRLETDDGATHCFLVDGSFFTCGSAEKNAGSSYLQFSGHGRCSVEQPNITNRWDYVRYGRITYGEQIIASDPPGGFVDARAHAPPARFTVTFDEANYVMVDEISVEVIDPPLSPLGKGGGSPLASARGTDVEGGPAFAILDSTFAIATAAPAVLATGRRDNGPPEEVEIVLDQPIPFNAITRFTFNDGVAVNVVEFTFAPGDTDGDGDADLADFAYMANCFAESPPESGPCLALDVDSSGGMDYHDYAAFHWLLRS